MREQDPIRSLPQEIRWLRHLVSLAPNDPDLRLDLAARLLERGFRDEAVIEIRSTIALAPNHLEARKLLERVLAHQSRPS